MALLDQMSARTRLATTARGRNVRRGQLRGNLYVIGRGDPTISSGRSYASSLPLKATYVGRFAKKIKASGVRRISGRVVGTHSYFAHDWWASGWKSFYPSSEVALPAALNFNGNTAEGTPHRRPRETTCGRSHQAIEIHWCARRPQTQVGRLTSLLRARSRCEGSIPTALVDVAPHEPIVVQLLRRGPGQTARRATFRFPRDDRKGWPQHQGLGRALQRGRSLARFFGTLVFKSHLAQGTYDAPWSRAQTTLGQKDAQHARDRRCGDAGGSSSRRARPSQDGNAVGSLHVIGMGAAQASRLVGRVLDHVARDVQTTSGEGRGSNRQAAEKPRAPLKARGGPSPDPPQEIASLWLRGRRDAPPRHAHEALPRVPPCAYLPNDSAASTPGKTTGR